MSGRANTRQVVFVLYDGLRVLDLAGPDEVFAVAAGSGADPSMISVTSRRRGGS